MIEKPTRRQALCNLTFGAASTGMLIQTAHAKPGGGPFASTAVNNPAGVCVLLPQAVAGPFYFDPKLVRSDISEGVAGAPVKLTLRVIEAKACSLLANVRVDIWHADARGIYSGYSGQGDQRKHLGKG